MMIIDDAHIDRFVGDRVIRKSGFADSVICMESGYDALDYLLSNVAFLPEVIFLDLNMPGMTGFEFLEQFDKLPEIIRENCSIVIASSSLHNADRELSLNNPYVEGFISKPLMVETLMELKEKIYKEYVHK